MAHFENCFGHDLFIRVKYIFEAERERSGTCSGKRADPLLSVRHSHSAIKSGRSVLVELLDEEWAVHFMRYEVSRHNIKLEDICFDSSSFLNLVDHFPHICRLKLSSNLWAARVSEFNIKMPSEDLWSISKNNRAIVMFNTKFEFKQLSNLIQLSIELNVLIHN